MFDMSFILIIFSFGFSVILLWQSVRSMLSGRSIIDFLPFFILGFAISFYTAALIFMSEFDYISWIFHYVVFVTLVWIFINFWRDGL